MITGGAGAGVEAANCGRDDDEPGHFDERPARALSPASPPVRFIAS